MRPDISHPPATKTCRRGLGALNHGALQTALFPSATLAEFYRFALLLTGDIGGDVEKAIAPHLTAAPIRILKVAHHGSRTSSSAALLDTWRPQIALVSAGRGNAFGHPAPDVLDRLQSIGARVYRTDRDGEITLTTDGTSVSVATFIGDVR